MTEALTTADVETVIGWCIGAFALGWILGRFVLTLKRATEML